MQQMTVNAAWQRDQLTALQQQGMGQMVAAIKTWQADQLNQFLQEGFPTRQHENWKYTNVAPVAAQAFNLSRPELLDDMVTVPHIENCYQMVFVNGQFSAHLSKLDLPPEIILCEFNNALADADWQRYLAIDKRYETPFTLLNSSLLSGGVLLRIPHHVRLDKPLHILYITTEKAKVTMMHMRHVIEVEVGASVEIFEEYQGACDVTYLNNIVTQINVQANAHVVHYKLQREGADGYHIANTIINQQRDSNVKTYHFACGAQLSRDDLNYALRERSTHCQLIGLYFARANGHIDNHTRIDHLVPQGSSRQIYKGIVADKARGVFNGKVMVHPDAQQTCALQANQNLLLSPQAQVDTKPELEIYADDVQCSHGATVGQLAEEALFYLRSRGIDAQQAQHLLTCGFANEILEYLVESPIAEYIKQYIVGLLATPQCHGDCSHA